MKFSPTGTIWWLVLSVIFIFLVDVFTISPKVISGNGNLGLLVLVPAVIVFLLLARSLWKALGRFEADSMTWKKIGVGAFFLLLACVCLEYSFFYTLVNELGGPPDIETSRIFRYSWLNQYTNTVFINFYTLGILIAIVILSKYLLKISKVVEA